MKTSVIVSALVVIAAAVGAALLPLWSIEDNSSAQHEFTINEPIERVRKIMVRSNAAKKIIAMADAELVDQKRKIKLMQHPIRRTRSSHAS